MTFTTDQDRNSVFLELIQVLQKLKPSFSSVELEHLKNVLQDKNGSATSKTDTTSANENLFKASSQVSSNCLNLIQEFEGYKQDKGDGRVQAYIDPVGIWTIGWGSTRNLDTNQPVRAGDIITRATAERWLKEEAQQVSDIVQQLCRVPLKQCMVDALVSFGYNIGTGGGGLRTSTLLKKLNAGDYEGAAGEFGRWVKGEVNGREVELPGLVRRRKAEEALFRRDGWLENGMSSPSTREIISTVDVRPYQPAAIPLPFNRILKEGATGDDCFVLNCALAGLGFLRVGSQPIQFTAVTRAAVELFQRREKLSVNGDVGPTTTQALELSLQQARSRVAPRSPDLVFCKLTRTRQPAYQGLEWCQLDFVNPQAQVLDSLKVVSGASGAQRFNLPEDSVAGSGEPIPQGHYEIGDIDWADGRDNYDAAFPAQGDGLGPVWVPLKGKQPDDRGAFGMHGDWNWIMERHSPGSAGCVCPTNKEDLRELVRLLRKYDPRELVVYWGL